MPENHRQNDNEHEASCNDRHHQHDLRLTMLESKTSQLCEVVNTQIGKASNTESALDKLSILFQSFLERYNQHAEQSIERERVNAEKLDKAVKFEVQTKTVFRVIVIICCFAGVVISGIYNYGKDSHVIVPGGVQEPTKK